MEPTTTVYDTKAIKTTPAPVEDIGWDKLDKKKFFLSSTVFILSVRALVYPIGLIKTRMQVQRVNYRLFLCRYGICRFFWLKTPQYSDALHQ